MILVAGKRLSGDQMREVSACGCDELLIAPMTADELHDVIAIQLGEPRPGTEAFAVTIAARRPQGRRDRLEPLDRRRAPRRRRAGLRGPGRRRHDHARGRDAPVVDQGHRGVGAAARRQDRRRHRVRRARRRARAQLAKLTQWQVVKDGERTRVVLRGDFTEATRFDELLPAMVGRIVFDIAQVTYMNSLGVRAWCEFLRQARIQGYEFHACSVPFVLQASMVRDVIGRGTVTSFFAPFHCISCDHQEERLLQSAAILASDLEPPIFKCPNCGGALEFDDLPERYFAFLQDDTD